MSTRREFIQASTGMLAAFSVADAFSDGAAVAAAPSGQDPADFGHFHPKGKPPSTHTIRVLEEARRTLPFGDTRDFDEQKRGLIAERRDRTIKADAGHNAWDLDRYQFVLENESYDSLHPSTHRMAKLNMNFGLYKVVDGVYQVRGFDLSQMTFVQGKRGWIVLDTLTAAETARAALELLHEHVAPRPISAVIYSHSHADHFGGVRGIVDEEDVRSGRVKIIGPRGFMDYAVSENVYAGNAMNRRLFYQYGVLLPVSPFGHSGQGLGQATAAGSMGLIAPTKTIEDDVEYLTIDGVEMVFQNTPGTEAPAEMNTYFPEFKGLWMAENVSGTLHNIYTLRGALVRDALVWSKYINEAIYMFGQEAEVMFTPHHWPRWGNERIQDILRAQRDLYAHMNNHVLHLANQGVTINEVHNQYRLPKSLQQEWHCRPYHGSPEHNSRAVINRYLGYWDCNPATLIPLSPRDSAPLYVRMMGGARRILSEGRRLHEAGEYLEAQEILNKLVHAEPDNEEAKDLLADVFEQIGYQQENPGLRNSFLAGAYELRSGIPQGASPKTSGPDVIRAMSTELFLDFLGIRMDTEKAEGLGFTINLLTPDNGETFAIELRNATLTNIKGQLADDADLSITIDRGDLEQVMMGEKSMDAQIADGTAKVEGDVGVLRQLAATMVDFDPGFEIMPGTKGVSEVAKLNPFEQAPIRPVSAE